MPTTIYLKTHAVQLPGNHTLGRPRAERAVTVLEPCVTRADGYRGPLVQMHNYGSNGFPNPQYALWQTNGRKDKDELVHSTKGEFIYNNNWGTRGARKGRVIRLSNANNIQQQYLTILPQDGPTLRHTPKEMDPVGSFIAPFSSEGR